MKTITLKNWKSFTDILEEIPSHKESIFPRWILRGQASSQWSLEPSLLRKINKFSLS